MAAAYFSTSRIAAESVPAPPGAVTITGRFETHFTISSAIKKAGSPLIVMIHGLGGSSVVFEPLERTLVDVAEPPTVLKYDLAGRGFSPHHSRYRYDLSGQASLLTLRS